MFPDPFLPRVAVTVGKGSGYARLVSVSLARQLNIYIYRELIRESAPLASLNYEDFRAEFSNVLGMTSDSFS